MTQVKPDDIVRIHYTGSLSDGTVFDSSDGRDPLEFKTGAGQVIPGLDEVIPGMSVGDKKTVNIPAAKAYGPHDENGILEVPRSELPADIPVEIGMQLEMRTPQGQAMPVTITQLTDEIVTLDANHFLAGKDLTFDIELMSIG